MRILVTGFGPFPGVERNTSGDAARAIDGEQAHGATFVGRVVDVSWHDAWPTIAQHVRDVNPAALVMLGVDVNSDVVRLERVAHNGTSARLDQLGSGPPGPMLVDGAATSLPTALPWETLCVEAVQPSDDAGRYLCNAVFFQGVHALGDTLPVGFVHVPPEPVDAVFPLLRNLARALQGAG